MRVRMSALTELAHFLATTKLNVAGSAVCSLQHLCEKAR